MGLRLFFHLEQWYGNKAFYKFYLEKPRMVIISIKVAFDIYMHSLFIYLLVFFIKKR
jgi:hypothetical protein